MPDIQWNDNTPPPPERWQVQDAGPTNKPYHPGGFVRPTGRVTINVSVPPFLSLSEAADCTETTVESVLDRLSQRVAARLKAGE